MKRILLAAVAAMMLFSAQASAQARWGVTGGMNFNTTKLTGVSTENRIGWNAGLTCLVDLPLGFSLQPSLVYSQKSANISENVAQNMGYVELPLSLQWGPDLLVFRPFVDVTPYVGYAVSNKTFTTVAPLGLDVQYTDSSWDGKERFEYGLGIGGGINVWKLQILARYCWNFGTLYTPDSWGEVGGYLKEHISQLKTDNEHFGGVTLSVSFLF